jgi:hypothetical protein
LFVTVAVPCSETSQQKYSVGKKIQNNTKSN